MSNPNFTKILPPINNERRIQQLMSKLNKTANAEIK